MNKEVSKMFYESCRQIFIFMSNNDSEIVQTAMQFLISKANRIHSKQGQTNLFLYIQKLLYITLEKKQNINEYEEHVLYLLREYGGPHEYDKYLVYTHIKNDQLLSPISNRTLLCLLIEIVMMIMIPKLKFTIQNFFSLYKNIETKSSTEQLTQLTLSKVSCSYFMLNKVVPVMLQLISNNLDKVKDVMSEKEIEKFREMSLSIYKNTQPNKVYILNEKGSSILDTFTISEEVVEIINTYWNTSVKVHELSLIKDIRGGVISAITGFFGKIGAKVMGSAVAKKAASSAAKVVAKSAKELTESATAGLSERLKDPSLYMKKPPTKEEPVYENVNQHPVIDRNADYSDLPPPPETVVVPSAPVYESQYMTPRQYNSNEEVRELKKLIEEQRHELEGMRLKLYNSGTDKSHFFVPTTSDEQRIIQNERLETAVETENAAEMEQRVRIDHLRNVMRSAKSMSIPVNYGPVQMDNLCTLELLHCLKLLSANTIEKK